jgi:hypothetical protein
MGKFETIPSPKSASAEGALTIEQAAREPYANIEEPKTA